MQKLSPRLQFVAGEIGKAKTIADIGTDHGKLIVYALENGLAERAFAVDISKKSLDKAKKNIEESGLSGKVDFFCGDGLLPLKEQPDVAIIAGMGGNEIVKILSEGHRADRLILVPHQDAYLVREYLLQNHYSIEKDYVIEDGKFYSIIVTASGESYYSDDEIILGKNNPNREAFGRRNEKRMIQIEKILREQGVGIEDLKTDIQREYEVLKKWSESRK
ncbi:MAG: SAM-dependent methyltransferase [Clostridia bacterium]|nr:SAM-dependent methyltransferase [Clostridia bacterium]